MLFMVGIENPANENEAYGVIVPVFEKLGYGCVTAADERKDVLKQARVAILEMVEELIAEGHLLSALGEDYNNYAADYPDYHEWVALEVPVESLKGKQQRINVTLAEPLLARVDAFVKAHPQYRDRSDFLATAADNQMRAG